MQPCRLKQLIGRQRDARALVDASAVALGAPVTIEDAEGTLLHGERHGGDRRRRACRSRIEAQRSAGCPGRRRRARRSRRCSITWSRRRPSGRRSAPRCCTSIARST